jgi:ferritin-like metal-binding protein YciE
LDKKIFQENYLEMVQEIYDAENQIIELFPLLIEAASSTDLKEAFRKHLKESEQQASRLESVFKMLGENPKEKTCHAIKGLVKEAKEIIKKKNLTNALKDSLLIIAAQKIEHYEIATYGGFCPVAKHIAKSLNDDKYNQICTLLKQSLEEEKKADSTLTDLAEGTAVGQGINVEAEKEISECCT